jgi:hypothetical protein
MESRRDAWTDERLDDLNHRVDEGFKEMREEFRAARGEVAAMNRSQLQLIIGSWATMMIGFAATIATISLHS